MTEYYDTVIYDTNVFCSKKVTRQAAHEGASPSVGFFLTDFL